MEKNASYHLKKQKINALLSLLFTIPVILPLLAHMKTFLGSNVLLFIIQIISGCLSGYFYWSAYNHDKSRILLNNNEFFKIKSENRQKVVDLIKNGKVDEAIEEFDKYDNLYSV